MATQEEVGVELQTNEEKKEEEETEVEVEVEEEQQQEEVELVDTTEQKEEEEAKDSVAAGIDEPPADPEAIPTRKDGGVWPHLYDECQNLLSSSVLMYAMADLRLAIRRGEVDDPVVTELFMTLPMESNAVMAVVTERKDIFAKFVGDDGTKDENGNETYPYLDFLMSKREIPLKKTDKKVTDKSPELNSDMELVEMHDEKMNEIVYGIFLNHQREWIEICFRGSVTTRDFIADVDPLMEFFPNPVESIRGYPQEKKIGVHSGFVFYMNGTVRNLGEGKSKMIKESVIALQEKYPHYRTYLTGHSLGGALATLTAFELATTEEIHKPVTCISVAAPMVGNIGFRNAFQALEKMGHVRCARVANRLDLITIMPTRVCWCCDVCCCCISCLCAGLQSRRYWQVGATVRLHANGTCEVSYERYTMSYREQMEHEFSTRGLVCRTFRGLFRSGDCGHGEGDFLNNHSCEEYMRRMNAAQDVLKAHRLQHLYFRQARNSINSDRVLPPLASIRPKDVVPPQNS